MTPSRSTCRQPIFRPCGGFSLLEVIIAMLVISLGLGATLLTLQIGLKQLDFARRGMVAAQAIQNESERLRLLQWDDIIALPEEADVDLALTFGANSIEGGDLRVVRRVQDMPGIIDMKVIELEATWNGVDGREHRARGFIHYTRGGINDYYYKHGVPAQLE